MRSHAIAEWIVGRFTSKGRAASILGDLEELKPQKGRLWFWLSLTGVVLSLTWRRLIAFVAALYAGSWAFGAFQVAILGVHAQHRPPEYPWMPVFLAISWVGAFLWLILLYAAIRYGLQDKLTQASLASTAIVTVILYCWWQPVVLAVSIAMTIFVVAASIANKQRLKAALALTVAVAAGFGGGFVATRMAALYAHSVITGPMGDVELRTHPSIGWVTFCALLMAAWSTTSVCSLVHTRLMRSKLHN